MVFRRSLRAPLLSLGALAILGVGMAANLYTPNTTPPPPSSQEAPHGQPFGVGPLLDGARGPQAPDAAQAAARKRASQDLPGAPDTIRTLATRLFLGQPITSAELDGIDPHLLGYVFHAPQSLDTGGGSLAREAARLGRIDALRAMGDAGLSTKADGDLLFWATVENWNPDTATDGQALLAQAAQEDGVNRVHEDGFTALEMAATVSMDAVAALLTAGANPWKHPSDPQETMGFPSVMERLSLHAGTPGALDIARGITQSPALPIPSQRAHWNTVGNLIDSAVLLETEGDRLTARQAAALAVDLEGRFGGVPEHFWSEPARALRPADAPELAPVLRPEDALATIPDTADTTDKSRPVGGR